MTNWLQEYLQEAARASTCMKIGCTTCGAADFRNGLLARLPGGGAGGSASSAGARRRVLDPHQSQAIAQALAGVERTSASWAEEAGIRFLLYEIWASGHLSLAIEALMAGSWAGRVLAAMREHEARRQTARRAHEMRNDAEAISARRESARRERQVRHAARLEAKRERDRLRNAQHRRATEGDQ